MRTSFLSKILSVALLGISVSASANFYVTQVDKNMYHVFDSRNGSSVYVRNPESYIKFKKSQSKVSGFGGSINNSKFSKTESIADKTVKAAGAAVGTAANTAYQAVNLTPSLRQYVAPAKAVMGNGNR